MKNSVINSAIIIALFFLFGCGTTKPVYTRTKPDVRLNENIVETIEVTGVAPIDKNRFEAREAALSNAFKTAIERVVGVFVDAHTETRKSKLIEQQIITDARGYVENYTVLDEKMKEEMYFISIKADVNLAKIYKKFETKTVTIRIKRPKNLYATTLLKNTLDRLQCVAYAEVVYFSRRYAEIKASLIDGTSYDIAEFLDKEQPKLKIISVDLGRVILKD